MICHTATMHARRSRDRLVVVLVAAITAGFGAGCSSREGDPGGGEASAAACSDGRDNDGDGLVDCAEPSCGAHSWCAGMDGGGSRDGSVGDARTPPGDRGPPLPPCTEPIDVVFVMDVSTSMMDEVDSVRAGVDSIWAAAQALTTDTQFSLVVFVDDVVSVNGCAAFDSVAAMQTELARWRDFTSTNNQPAGSPYSNSDCPENSLDALYTAATTCPWREGATHIVIHVTDDTFEERPFMLSNVFGIGGIPVLRTYSETVSALMAGELRVGVFAAPGAGEFCGAGSSPDVGRGFHAPFNGMPSVAEATGGRAWSIRDVRAGTLDMAEAIGAFARDEYCTLY